MFSYLKPSRDVIYDWTHILRLTRKISPIWMKYAWIYLNVRRCFSNGLSADMNTRNILSMMAKLYIC
jgi:hypothetical protein